MLVSHLAQLKYRAELVEVVEKCRTDSGCGARLTFCLFLDP